MTKVSRQEETIAVEEASMGDGQDAWAQQVREDGVCVQWLDKVH